MLITLEQMRKLHAIQLEMFKELKRVMEELNIRYYFVHGSLLSAVTTHQFIEEDDDIDIAIFRDDYERLMEKGNDIVSSKYFIQCSKNDDFPLSFAKFRNNETEFNQPVLSECNCNKGIYIDIFPIDFVPEKESRLLKIKRYLLKTRINAHLHTQRSFKHRCLIAFSKLIYPSYRTAINKRESMYSSCNSGKYVTIFGGKGSEQRLLNCWFGAGVSFDFCGIEVNCPNDYNSYLTRIYGSNYIEKNPAEDRIFANKMIEVSASYIDFGNGDCIGYKSND
ncbi:MAG: LicD family protein [Clostridia bacterium]|nr:LicD family protein [Clostridia bacterium]